MLIKWALVLVTLILNFLYDLEWRRHNVSSILNHIENPVPWTCSLYHVLRPVTDPASGHPHIGSFHMGPIIQHLNGGSSYNYLIVEVSTMTHKCTGYLLLLTHWGRVMHICVSRLTITGSDNGLSPGGRQTIIWTNAGILLIGPLGTNFSENLIEILTFSFTKMRLKLLSAKWRPFHLGLNVLTLDMRLYILGI